MSFRFYLYYCACLGGLSAYVGWAFGKSVHVESDVLLASLRGGLVGLLLGSSLGLIDAVWTFGTVRWANLVGRYFAAGIGGAVAGLLGGAAGQSLYGQTQASMFLIAGWALTGLLVGAASAFSGSGRGARRKFVHGALGGCLGGLLGGLLFIALRERLALLLHAHSTEELWSPSATGFAALGICIGLFVGLAQVLLREAWLRVESGFRPGRELLLSKDETTIGRAESCDLGIFGSSEVEPVHARIARQGDRFVLRPSGGRGVTLVNGKRIDSPTALQSGDRISLGPCTIRFGERRAKPEGSPGQ